MISVLPHRVKTDTSLHKHEYFTLFNCSFGMWERTVRKWKLPSCARVTCLFGSSHIKFKIQYSSIKKNQRKGLQQCTYMCKHQHVALSICPHVHATHTVLPFPWPLCGVVCRSAVCSPSAASLLHQWLRDTHKRKTRMQNLVTVTLGGSYSASVPVWFCLTGSR